MRVSVAIQGDIASFHHIAANKYFEGDIDIISCNTFSDTFVSLKNDECDFAICAIENSLFGSINETYDLLVKHKFNIVGEVYLRIKQCLIVNPGTVKKDIKTIYSHPVAFAQCEDYLDFNFPKAKKLEYHDTAASVKMIRRDKSKAAIASIESAKLYKMDIFAKEIETNKKNYTRFIVLDKSRKVYKSANKTSLIIRTSNKPASLYKALKVFADRSINLSKLQSRPIIGKAWHYMFYVDVQAGINDSSMKEAIDELVDQKCEVLVLGSYVSANKL